MRDTLRNPLIALLIPLALSSPLPARANGAVVNAAELAMLPDWCHSAVGLDSEGNIPRLSHEAKTKFDALTASGCYGFYHYCWGLANALHGYFWTESDKTPAAFYFGQALAEANYVLGSNRDKVKCPLIPELHTKAGEMEALLGRPKEAETRFKQALSFKPTYAPAYVGLSDLFENQGQTDKAIAVLQQGIKINPDSSLLKKKLARVQARVAGDSTETGTAKSPTPPPPPAPASDRTSGRSRPSPQTPRPPQP